MKKNRLKIMIVITLIIFILSTGLISVLYLGSMTTVPTEDINQNIDIQTLTGENQNTQSGTIQDIDDTMITTGTNLSGDNFSDTSINE